jgi:hypothetical protein
VLNESGNLEMSFPGISSTPESMLSINLPQLDLPFLGSSRVAHRAGIVLQETPVDCNLVRLSFFRAAACYAVKYRHEQSIHP